MNGPHTMYRMKPVLCFTDEIELPQCMYKMKNIQETFHANHEDASPTCPKPTSISEQVKKLLKCPLPEVAALENRQEAILKQLNQLKEQMTALRKELRQSVPKPINETQHHTFEAGLQDRLQDIVVNVSPQHPPYSLIALARLWNAKVNLRLSCHVHSTVVNAPKNECFSNMDNQTGTENVPELTIFIVWKNVGAETEMVISPISQSTVRGEPNILRYLCRVGPVEYNYEQSENLFDQTKIDEILDSCYHIARCRTKKERLQGIFTITSELGKSDYLLGKTSPSVADIAFWSVLKQVDQTTCKDLASNVVTWFQRCSEIFSSGQ
ncbi:probable aminoacyl tRNA synthase complex-interacting multifunctional protein 2 isoform X1 [Schistocerca americana]|uniref:probable aminoacyl tRNA synthase complex-interacting multifunctional protein 2 isoform X1 n=1 Tax=Schistocerca americana TaxID=7009 RepID=UPI001F4F1AA1|nr:probable aminoacyl tRNA synthase complex-interacting multifunctional protein 2 isoform X1 [Schistocerca americana]